VAAQFSGKAVAVTTAGFVLFWSGIKGQTLGSTLRDLLKGQPVPAAPQAPPAIGISSGGSPAAPQAAVTNSAIANDALGYTGHCYVYGGAPGPQGTGCWDCSSFCNWVLGHDFHMVLPGETQPGYEGTTHGPTTLSYLAWPGAVTVGHSAADAAAGDLCVWQTHMGIATGNGNIVSALNPSLGTRETTISAAAPPGELLFVRRVTQAGSPPVTTPLGKTIPGGG
jgi:hypothetical protein